MSEPRGAQLEYSELQGQMLDEGQRRQKAAKILAVLRHYLGADELAGRRALDVGCSTGFIADELTRAGAVVAGTDIDRPGLARAHGRFGDHVGFVCADGARLPFPDGSFDLLVFNHIYEHVVDPEATVAELWRVLADDGVAYFGLGNRLGVVEPHYKLPFLSYLPPKLADRYVRVARRAPHYHERLRTRPHLRRLLGRFHLWDYTLSVLREPQRFSAGDVVPGAVTRVPRAALRSLLGLVPTYLWVGTKRSGAPSGPSLLWAPERVGRPA